MKAGKVLSLLVGAMMLTSWAYAKELKVAYVELGGVFNNYKKTKEYDANLQKESKAAQEKMDQMLNKMREAQGKLELMKEDEKKKVQADIDKQKTELINFQQQKRTELAKKFEDMRKEILLEIEKVTNDIAQKEDYTFIFNDTVLLYGDKTLNLTEKVLKALNDNYSGKK